MVFIDNITFDFYTPKKIKEMPYGENWPAVYIINNEKEAYIGETVNASIRMKQHLKNERREKLNNITLISEDKFNKSVILDLESFLINHMAADGKFILQNGNMGIQQHNYYQQYEYEDSFNEIWNQLKKRNLVEHTLHEISNSDLFKYSPYKSLGTSQYEAINTIIQILSDSKEEGKSSSIIVNGGAGTGKTVLAVYLMKLLVGVAEDGIEIDSNIDSEYRLIAENIKKIGKINIGLVIPMQSLRSTIKNVFKNIQYLNKNMVLSPNEVFQKRYDLLIVDEAHRLRQRKGLAQYPVFDKNNNKLGLDNTGTELDWILKCSENQIFFYDSMQSVKPSDVDKKKFDELKNKIGKGNILNLTSQFRCMGGNDYIQYIENMLEVNRPIIPKVFNDYEFKLYRNVDKMVKDIKKKDKKIGLCRVIAGYSWEWKSKKDSKAYDINIDGYKYRWNSVDKDWVNSPNSINEIGCIHTIQGYDLNYAGVILGNEIKYDVNKKEIYIDKINYKDLSGKRALKNEESLKEYIINIYKTLLTRGIRGTYVYVCDKELENYLKEYIKSVY